MYQIKFCNLLAGAIMMGVIWVYCQKQQEILGVLVCVAKMGPEHPLYDRLSGLIALAVIVLGVVCFARLLSADRSNDN